MIKLDIYRAGVCTNIHVHTLGNAFTLITKGHKLVYVEHYESVGNDPVIAFEMTSDHESPILDGRDQWGALADDFAAVIRHWLDERFPKVKQFYLRNVYSRFGMQCVELADLEEEIKSDAVDFFPEYSDE